MQYSLTLDGYDIKLLAALQENATLTNQQLADAVNLSPSQCSRRRASLEQRKLIIACEARLDREQLGYGLTVFVSVMLNTHNRDNARKFAELMKRLPMVLEATRILDENIVRDPRDVDLGLIFGTGFPPFKGGLLFWADTLGAKKIIEMLKPLESLGERAKPTPMIEEMAKSGRGFYG